MKEMSNECKVKSKGPFEVLIFISDHFEWLKMGPFGFLRPRGPHEWIFNQNVSTGRPIQRGLCRAPLGRVSPLHWMRACVTLEWNHLIQERKAVRPSQHRHTFGNYLRVL